MNDQEKTAAEHKQVERKGNARTLQESEEWLRALFDDAPEAIILAELRTGRIVDANPAASQLLGRPRQEIIGMHQSEVHPPELCDFSVEKFTEYAGSQWVREMEYVIVRADGRHVPVEISARPICLQGETLAMGVFRDITERKQAERELLKVRNAVDGATDAIGIADNEGNPIYHNASFVKLFGYTADEMRAAGGPVIAFCNPDDAEAVFSAVRRGETWIGELQMKTRYGRTVPMFLRADAIFDDRGSIVGLLGIHTDITQRKKAEEALRQGEERYRSLVETTSDWVWEVDSKLVYTYASPRIKDFLGYEPEEVLGKRPFDFMPPDEAKRVAEMFWKGIQSPKRLVTLENTNIHKDGHTVVLETSAVPIIGPDGTALGYRGIDRDITERKRVDEALQKEQQVLRELLNMQERDRRLIAYEIHDGLAQQLTGALFRFQAFAELMERDPEEARKTFDAALGLLAEGVAETRRLIGGLRPPILDESGVLPAIDYLVCEIRERSGLEIELFTDVQFNRLASPLEGALFRIVQESLTNACRYSKTEKVRVELVQRGDQIGVTIQDWGIGFNPEEVEEDRFGLQGIRERARLLDGRATIDSAPGKGTRIHIELPLLTRSGQWDVNDTH